MASVRCQECKKEIEREDTKCPHCGYTEPGMAYIIFTLGIIVLYAILTLLGAWLLD